MKKDMKNGDSPFYRDASPFFLSFQRLFVPAPLAILLSSRLVGLLLKVDLKEENLYARLFEYSKISNIIVVCINFFKICYYIYNTSFVKIS